jgi:hypothetical protein
MLEVDASSFVARYNQFFPASHTLIVASGNTIDTLTTNFPPPGTCFLTCFNDVERVMFSFPDRDDVSFLCEEFPCVS